MHFGYFNNHIARREPSQYLQKRNIRMRKCCEPDLNLHFPNEHHRLTCYNMCKNLFFLKKTPIKDTDFSFESNQTQEQLKIHITKFSLNFVCSETKQYYGRWIAGLSLGWPLNPVQTPHHHHAKINLSRNRWQLSTKTHTWINTLKKCIKVQQLPLRS